MREHQVYIEFEKAAMALDLSEDQALQLDTAQIKQMAKADDAKLSENFIANLKTLVVEEIRAKKDMSTLNSIKALLQGQFPKMQAQICRDVNGPVVTIYLEGQKGLIDG